MKIFKYQFWHLVLLAVLLLCITFCVHNDSSLLQGELLGIDTSIWLIAAILSPIIHQVYVLLCWRLELYYGSLSKNLGDKGFKWYKIGFAILILSRIVTITFLAISNANTLDLNRGLGYTLGALLFIPAAYLFYSVKNYFGMDRAFGIDHFQPEKFKNEPFIKKGIFKYTSNGMYIFGFFILYVPGLIFLSKAAILVAIFNHVYIWIHYYFTELPDIKTIYKD